MAFIVINFYIFTIDKEGKEKVLDQIKDFTAFFVIVEIDKFLVGYSDVTMDDLKLKYKNKTLEDKFDRYVTFHNKIFDEMPSYLHALVYTLKK